MCHAEQTLIRSPFTTHSYPAPQLKHSRLLHRQEFIETILPWRIRLAGRLDGSRTHMGNEAGPACCFALKGQKVFPDLLEKCESNLMVEETFSRWEIFDSSDS